MDFLSLLTGVPTLINAFKGGTSAPYQKQQEELARKNAEYSAALADTSNPLYKKLYGQYREQGAQNLSKGIAEAQAQNRLATKMGRTPLLSNDRGGEALFRQLMGGYQGLGTTADQQTRSALQSALSGTGSSLSGYNAISPFTQNKNYSQMVGFNTIENMLRGKNTPLQQQPQGGDDFYKKLAEALNQKTQGQQPSSWSY